MQTETGDVPTEIADNGSEGAADPKRSKSKVFHQSIPNEDGSFGPVYKSPLDNRQYKALELPNGMKVLLISTLSTLTPYEASNKQKLCQLKDILKFNKQYLGLDQSSLKIRCECEQNETTMEDKTTSPMGQISDTNITLEKEVEASADDAEEPMMTLSEAWRAIKSLMYGDSENESVDSRDNSSESESFDSRRDGDYDAQSASAYLSVGCGWFNDPIDIPGLAHFVEHCFFLGSKKFPYPNQLFRLILPHDGYANAYTSGSQTMYCVATDMNIYASALEVLADAISCPLLPRDLVGKEVEAIDAEFSTRQEDMPKYHQLLASLAKSNHPLHKMDAGNKKTLQVPNFYNRMVEWRAAHYGANYMTLTLEAPVSIEELEELARTYFKDIRPLGLPSPHMRIAIPESPFDMQKFHKVYFVPSIFHSEFMTIHWALEPEAWKNLSTKPLNYLGALISHKGDGGLFKFLDYFGWISNISAGCWEADTFANQYTSVFSIIVDLTDKGFENETLVIEAIFGYIEMLRQNEPSLSFFQELQLQQGDYFHHRAAREFTSYAEDCCFWMQCVPPEYAIVAPSLCTKFDPELIVKYTKRLVYETCNVMLFSKKFLSTDDVDSMECYYQTPYSAEDFPGDLAERIDTTSKILSEAFQLPKPNIFIQEITCCGNQQKNLVRNGPVLVVKGKCSIQYKDDRFKPVKGQQPQAKYLFAFHSSVVNLGIKHQTMIELYASFLNEMIESKFSSALAAEFNIHCKTSSGQIILSITGPSFQLPQVLKDIFKLLVFFELLLNEESFDNGKERFIERVDDVTLDNRNRAWNIADFIFSNYYYQISSDTKFQAENITFEDFVTFVFEFKKKFFLIGHLFGFITIEQAMNIVQTISSFMRIYPDEIQPHELQPIQCPQLPIGESIVRVRSENTRTSTSVIVNGYQFGHLDREEQDIVRFLAKSMSDIAYFQLRTMEQLGYIVLVYEDNTYSVTSLFFELVTQPKNYTTDYCNERIDAFISDFFDKYISTDEKFLEFNQGKPKATLSLPKLQELFKQFLLPNTETYRKLSIQVVGSIQDAFMLTQHAEMYPSVYFSSTKPHPAMFSEYVVGHDFLRRELKSRLLSTTQANQSRLSIMRANHKKQKSSRNSARFSAANNTFPRSQSVRIFKKTTENVNTFMVTSKLVDDIHDFKGSLSLYTNTEGNDFEDIDDDEY